MMLHLICCSCCFIRCETGMRLSAVKSKFYSVALVVVVGGDASTGTPPCTAPCTSAQKDKFLLVFLFLLRGDMCNFLPFRLWENTTQTISITAPPDPSLKH